MYNGILTFLLIISFEAKGGNFFRGIVMKKKNRQDRNSKKN